MNLSDKTASLIDHLISLCMYKRTHAKKRQSMYNFENRWISVSKHPNILLLKRGKTDDNRSETSCESKIIYGEMEHAGHVKYRAQS